MTSLALITILLLLPRLLITSHAATHCNRSCIKPGHKPVNVQYPFGFSDGCEIRLNCTASGEMNIRDFSVQSINLESIRITLQSRCNRSFESLQQLYSPNFAPTNRNAILLQNCTHERASSSCEIPNILVQARFDAPPNCSAASSSLSCYAETNKKEFLDFETVKQKDCKYLLSSISAPVNSNSTVAPPLMLEVEVVDLGWWLEGSCKCDKNANCTEVVSPKGSNGYRCNCNEGFEGDGFQFGLGCRNVKSACNPSKYMSGQCGTTARVIVLVGGIFLGASLMVSLGLIFCFIRRQSKMKSRHFNKRRLSEATGNCKIPIYPYKEIEKATNGFSEKQRLGTGAYGTVYAAKLHDISEWVAIKRIKHGDSESIEQVMNEIKLISSVRHTNLVRLLGCSIERGEQILVYEFMPNGTLCQHLQKERGDGLAWPTRLTIATETAQAIAHLHSAVKPPIYHRDIKSSNILLDFKFKAKVADFGLSRLGMAESSHISTAPQGTPGYLDPQYHQNFHLSDKSDVYSFGVVLVEIITGLKAVDFSRPQNEVNLAALATDRIGKGCLDEIIDPFLEPHMDSWSLSSVHKVSELAFRCLAFHRDMRPSMTEVAAELEQIKLSRWSSFEENTYTASSEISSFGSSSSVSEKPLNISKSQTERSIFVLQTGADSFNNSLEKLKDDSPVCVQDTWLSEQSSPSSNSLLSNAIL